MFSLDGAADRVSIGVGTCVFDSEGGQHTVDQRAHVLERLMRFAYPGAETVQQRAPILLRNEWACVWVGVPKLGQLPRIVRALSGLRYSVLIIAQPLDLEKVSQLIDEAGDLKRAYLASVADSKLSEPAIDLLQSYLGRYIKRMQLAATVGGWRVGVYMMSERNGAAACRATYRAAYATAAPGNERLAWWDGPEAASWAVQWGLPDAKERHPLVPFPWQSVLSSNELANLMCLPNEELPGFRLLDQPSFDVIPPLAAQVDDKTKAPSAITLGRVVSDGQPLELDYSIRTEQLTSHSFIAGTTGSGKTNTVFHLLRQLMLQKIPFLVVEPTKTEYRALIREPEFAGLRVYTLGNELGVPLRLNPLAPEPGTSIAEHIDLLKGVIGASIGAWNPLPQILEKALHRVFRESGWDIVSGTNHRVKGDQAPQSAYPTLVDLLDAAIAVTRVLGYSERVGPDIEAALRVRIESLLAGGKGRMLGSTEQQSIKDLLSQPTVVELESIVDEDECAFVMGLLLIRMVEHLRARGNTSSCRVVVVIEEAHRLLGEAQRSNPEVEGSARFKAVSMFANLLAEVRAYGAGLVICDQSPSKLSRDVLKNTNTKIAHRIVSADDAAALAMAMRLRQDQAGALASMTPGRAAVFSGGDDYPILVAVPLVKKGDAWPTNEEVRKASNVAPSLDAPHAASVWIDQLIATREWLESVDRLLNVLVATPARASDAWQEVSETAARCVPMLPKQLETLKYAAKVALIRALRERGRIYGWAYEELDQLIDTLDPAISTLSTGTPDRAFTTLAGKMHRLSVGPLLSCALSCAEGGEVACVFRASAARLSDSPDWRESWHGAERADGHESLKRLLAYASEMMIGSHGPGTDPKSSRRAMFCYAQHMIAKEKDGHPKSMILENNEFVWALSKEMAPMADKGDRQ